jgi:hypothetical protein
LLGTQTKQNKVKIEEEIFDKIMFNPPKKHHDKSPTKSPIYPNKYEQAISPFKKRKPVISNFKPTQRQKNQKNKKKLKWTPDKTPNSPKHQKDEQHQYYPQSSLWTNNNSPHDLQISPMFGQRPANFKLNSELFFQEQSGKWDKNINYKQNGQLPLNLKLNFF